jgi:hypothetical protein
MYTTYLPYLSIIILIIVFTSMGTSFLFMEFLLKKTLQRTHSFPIELSREVL